MQTKDRADFTVWLICATIVFLLVILLPPGREMAQEYAVDPLAASFALDPLFALVLVAVLSTAVLRLIHKLW